MAVEVGVGVSVGVDVLVGVKVIVGVGVSVAKRAFIGLLGPASQKISNAIPPSINRPARIVIILGAKRFLCLRYGLSMPDDEDERGGLLFIDRFLFTKRFIRRFPTNAM